VFGWMERAAISSDVLDDIPNPVGEQPDAQREGRPEDDPDREDPSNLHQ